MARSSSTTPLLALGALAAGALVFAGTRSGVLPLPEPLSRRLPERMLPPSRRRGHPQLTLQYARKWGPIFGAPVPYIMTLAHIETGHKPDTVNMAVKEKGGAWGLVQQMADEAGEKVRKIKASYGHLPEVSEAASKWKGDPHNLLDPDLNVMLAAWQIGKLTHRFRRFDLVAAAYHQGEHAIARRLAEGRPPVEPRLQPKGTVYVSRAASVFPLYQNVV